MGVVPMEIKDSFLSHGCSYVYQAVYVYCDRCGTFDVRRTVHPREWVKMAGGLAVVLLILMKGPSAGHLNLALAGSALLLLAIVIAGTWGLPDYRCRRCRCSVSTRYNTRQLPSARGLVDVPEGQVQKFYLNYWTDLCDLEEYLRPPGGESGA